MGLTKDLGALPRVITVSGSSVGVGTVSPSEKLEVYGSLRLADGNADGPQLKLASSGFSDWNIDNLSGSLRAYYGSTERMRITSGGNVGIGLTSPSQRLDVNGSVTSTNLPMYSGTFNSGSSVSMPLKSPTQRARLFLVHYYFSGNANINAARLMMVNTRNTLVGGGNSIAVISTTQNSTGTPNEPTSFTQSIGGSGENLTLVIGASMVGGSGSITVEIQELSA